MPFFKHHKFIIVAFPLLAIAFVAIFYVHRVDIPDGDPNQEYILKHANQPLTILDFNFTGNREGEKFIAIKAARHTIEERKFAFFKMAQAYVAKFRGATIDIYGTLKTSNKDLKAEKQMVHYSFSEIFSDEGSPILFEKKVILLIFEPVTVNLYDKKSLLTQIKAERASIDRRRRAIVFEGNIHAQSGTRNLSADHLTMFSDNGMIEGKGKLVPDPVERQPIGEKLKTDICLNRLRMQ